MASAAPLVSVVMPVYNAGDSLQRTLDALAAQTHERCEFICVNDGSMDDSLQTLQTMAERDPRFQIVDQPNGGAYRARFTGVEAAQGDYIGFCDAGDLPLPHMVETLLSRIQETQADVAVGAFRRAPLGEADDARPEMTSFGDSTLAVTPESGWFVTVNPAPWNKLYRREPVQELVPLPEPPRVAEDALFLLDLAPRIQRVTFTAEPLYDYIVEEGSAVQHVSAEDFYQTVSAWRELRQRLAGESPAYLDMYDLAAFVHLGVSLPTRMEGALPYREIQEFIDASFPQQQCTNLMNRRAVTQHPTLRMASLAHAFYQLGLMAPALGAYNLINRLAPSEIKW